AEVVPKVWLLTRTVRSRVFQQKTVPQILSQVFQGYDIKTQYATSYEPRDYCVQYDESDFDFASRLMEEEGIFYFFTHTEDGHQLQAPDSSLNPPAIPGDPHVLYRQIHGDLGEDEVVVQWQKSQEIRSGKYTLRDRNFELDSSLEASKPMAQTVQAGTVSHRLPIDGNDALEIYRFPGGHGERFDGIDPTGGERGGLDKVIPDGERTAGVRIQQETLPGLGVQGAGNSRLFTAGSTFSLKDHYDGDGSYLLTRVEHMASAADSYAGGDPE